jgi:drug/metabolite transporter (DMT)-like permease
MGPFSRAGGSAAYYAVRPMGRPVLCLLLANVIGGLTYPWQKMALEGLPPATVTALRSLLSLVLMAGWLALRRERPWPFPRRETGRLALVGILGVALPMLLGAEGVHRSTATNASLLILLEPVSIVLFARLLLGERMGPRPSAGLVLGLAGAVVVVTEGLTAGPTLLRGEHLIGNVLLALSGILWGIYTPLMKPLAGHRDPVALTFGSMAFAMALFVPAALVEAPRWTAGPSLAKALLCTAALGLLGSFLGTVLWTAALRHVSANAVAPLIFLQPVVSAIAGALFLDETISVQAGIGGAIVAVGVLVGLSAEPAASAPGPRRTSSPS